jgi:tRNA pseudouridine32 synthase/23S rRNA pseudouridine746 synthase
LPLPIRDGVAASHIWLQPGQWPDMLTFLLAQFPDVSELTWQSRMQRAEVRNQHGAIVAPDSRYCVGDCIFYYREIDDETPVPFEESILYQDEHILVADKPHFLAVTPGGRFLHETLLVRLKKKTGLADLTPVHRIDRETAGLVLFSHNPASRAVFHGLFQQRTIHKTYEALTDGPGEITLPAIYRSRLVPGNPFFLTQEAEGAPNSETHISLLRQSGTQALYRLSPITGRKHQLRVHLAALGRPIMFDRFYPQAVAEGTPDDYLHPLKLLARAIEYIDPIDGRAQRFESARTL